jgi:hypothetical protein
MQCADFWAPYMDWLGTPPQPPETPPTVSFLIAGNRSEQNRFVLFMIGELTATYILPGAPGSANPLPGSAEQYFSDRVEWDIAPVHGIRRFVAGQPFDRNQTQRVTVYLTVPDGPLQFQNGGGVIESSYRDFQCTDSGLLICTSEFDRSVIVMSLQRTGRH